MALTIKILKGLVFTTFLFTWTPTGPLALSLLLNLQEPLCLTISTWIPLLAFLYLIIRPDTERDRSLVPVLLPVMTVVVATRVLRSNDIHFFSGIVPILSFLLFGLSAIALTATLFGKRSKQKP